jgi:hypothetical protein
MSPHWGKGLHCTCSLRAASDMVSDLAYPLLIIERFGMDPAINTTAKGSDSVMLIDDQKKSEW